MEVLWSPVLKKSFKRLEGKENSSKSNIEKVWTKEVPESQEQKRKEDGDSSPPLSVYAESFVLSSSLINPIRLLQKKKSNTVNTVKRQELGLP